MDENKDIEQAGAEAKAQAREEALQTEYSKIVWPKGKRVWSETLTVIIVAAIIATIIFFVDLGIRSGIEEILRF